MSDKILKEAYDKIAAIEASEDPFCIGAKDQTVNEYEGFRPERSIRDEVIDAVDAGMIDKDYLINACLKYMSHDDVKDMLRANDISLDSGEY